MKETVKSGLKLVGYCTVKGTVIGAIVGCGCLLLGEIVARMMYRGEEIGYWNIELKD